MYENVNSVYRRALCNQMAMHRYYFHNFILFYINLINCLVIIVNSDKGHKVNRTVQEEYM